MLSWRSRDTHWRPTLWLVYPLISGVLGACSKTPCEGEACPIASTSNQEAPTSVPVDATDSVDANVPVQSSASLSTPTPDVPDCRIDEDCPASAPVCSPSRQCVACVGDDDCGGTPGRPYCKVATSEENNRCVACQKGTDCGADGAWACVEEQCFAACDPATDESVCGAGLGCVTGAGQTLGYCAECGEGLACADPSLLCVGNTCLTCDPVADQGCTGTTPHCQAKAVAAPNLDAGASGDAGAVALGDDAYCVECRTGGKYEDCSEGTCIDGTCQTCNPNDHAGCGREQPFCRLDTALDGGADVPSCVECLANGDCAANAAGAFCIDGSCSACDPSDASSCSGDLDVCANIAPSGQQALYECRQCTPEVDHCTDGLVCVGFDCVECRTSTDCPDPAMSQCNASNKCVPCTSDAACEHLPDSPLCDSNAGSCIQCREDTDCANTDGTPACYTYLHKCVECTSGDHCPEPSLGCSTFPGPEFQTCIMPETAPNDLEVCARCHTGECAEGDVCATLGEQGDRCAPVAQPDDSCTSAEMPASDGSGPVWVCIPDDCAP